MLIVHRLSPGGHRYYLAGVDPRGCDEPSVGEAPGWWLGAGARARELAGPVAGGDLRAVLPSGAGRVPGFDCTFAAPKSVSVLHGLGDPAVAAVVRAVHDEAVAAGVAYLERYAAAVRESGRVTPGGGLTAAAFRHRVSRADEPHLHTHVLVANVGSGPDGRPRALHSPLLYAERRGAGAVYHLCLRHGLAVRLGVRWRPPEAGRADLENVPDQVLRAFSSRRAAVLAADGAFGSRRWAERATRPARHAPPDVARLRDGWRARAAGLGWTARLDGPVGPFKEDRARWAVRGGAWPGPVVDRLVALDRWTRSDLLVALAGVLRDGAAPNAVESLCQEVLDTAPVVCLGREASSRHASERFTTTVARARRSRIDTTLRPAARIGPGPYPIEDLRRRAIRRGHRVLFVAPDERSALAAEARSGTPAVGLGDAVAALRALGLGPGDVVVLDRPGRLPGAAMEALLAAMTARRVQAVVADGSPEAVREPHDGSPVPAVGVSVATASGDLTVSATVESATRLALGDWLVRRVDGPAALLVAGPAELGALNERARQALRRRGLLGDVDVGGVAAGEPVTFAAGRPSLGVARHDRGRVVDVDRASGLVWVDIAGRPGPVRLAGAEIGALRPAHAVAPVGSALAGADEVFALGVGALHPRPPGRSKVAVVVHHYVTVAMADPPEVGTVADAGFDDRRRLPTGPLPPGMEGWWRAARAEALARAVELDRPGTVDLGLGPVPVSVPALWSWRQTAVRLLAGGERTRRADRPASLARGEEGPARARPDDLSLSL